jgi:hypothetical protein
MRSKLLAVSVLATMWACGGATFVSSVDGGSEGGGGSSSGGSSGSSSGSGGGSSSSSSSGGSSSSSGGSSSSSSSGGSSSSSGGSSGSSSSSSGGSSSSSSSGGSSGSSSGGSSGSVDAGTPVCPASPPTGGSACSDVGLECEYGSSPSVACDEVAKCEASGWTLTEGSCPPPTCPATYADVPQGKACTPEGLDCAYALGECNCSHPELVTVGQGPVWECSTPAKGCPEFRPRLGTPCSQPALECDYGYCTGGDAVECLDGTWHREETACPL